MNIDYLKNYITIVEEKSFSKASKKLFIAQPSLSNQVKYLEDMYRTKLMYRGGKTIRLTPSGKELYAKARKIVSLYEQSFVNLNNINNGLEDKINIALPPSVYSLLINKLFSKFFEEYPHIKFNVYECNALTAEQYLNDDIVDIAVINAHIKDFDKVNYLVLDKEEFVVYLPPNHKLLKKEVLELSDLENEHLVVPRAYESDIISRFHALNMNPLIDITTVTTMASMSFAKEKKIIAIVPLPYNEVINNEFMRPLELEAINENSRKIIYLKDKELSFACKEFIRLAKVSNS